MSIKKSILFIAVIVALFVLTACTNTVEFTITFDSNGGTDVNPQFVEEGNSLELPIPIKEGHSFIGWFTGDGANDIQFSDFTPVTKDTVLYAKWEINQYTISFDSNGGSEIGDITQDYNSAISEPEYPEREGYTFIGWDYVIPTKMPSENIELTAQWEINQYTISFDSDGGSEIGDITQDYNSVISEPSAPFKEGHSFVAWCLDEDLLLDYSFTTMPAEEITLYAKWEINQYTISFDSNGGSEIGDITQDYNSAISEPEYPEREGYTFISWDYVIPTKMPSENIKLTAQWEINQYTIRFDSNGGSEIGDITQDYNSVISEPNAPFKEGHSFVAWCLDEDLLLDYSFTTIPAEEITLYAKWSIKSYKLNYFDATSVDFPEVSIALKKGEYVIDVFAGMHASVIQTSEYRVFAWGNFSEGLVEMQTYNLSIPLEITDYLNLQPNEIIKDFQSNFDMSILLTSDGRILRIKLTGVFDITPTFQLGSDESIYQISLGKDYFMALTNKHSVYTFGNGYYGQLGNGLFDYQEKPIEISNYFNLNENDYITDIHAGFYVSTALSKLGEVFIWGNNESHLMMNENIIKQALPLNISDYFDLDLDDQIIKVSAYTESRWNGNAIAISGKGKIFTWGHLIGNGTNSFSDIPIDITYQFDMGPLDFVDSGSNSTNQFILTSEGKIYRWGTFYTSSYDTSHIDEYNPVEFSNIINLDSNEIIVTFDVGRQHIIMLSNLGNVYLSGLNQYGALGNGIPYYSPVPIEMTSFISLNSDENIESFSSGSNNSFVLTTFQRILLWGQNAFYSLGNDSNSPHIFPYDATMQFELSENEKVKSIVFGSFYSFLLTDQNRVYAWGRNNYGQLGVTSSNNYSGITDISLQFGILYDEETYESIDAGSNHSALLTSFGRLFMWGDNSYGQLGNESIISTSIPIDITMQFNLSQDEKIIKVHIADNISSVITSMGRAFIWGQNSNGELGLGTSTNQHVPYDMTQLFELKENEKIIDLKIGTFFSLALTDQGRIFSWGKNNITGSLGTGDNSSQLYPVDITHNFSLENDEIIISIYKGTQNALALTSNRRVFRWGESYPTSSRIYSSKMNFPEEITKQFNLLEGEYFVKFSLNGQKVMGVTNLSRLFVWYDISKGETTRGILTNQNIPKPLQTIYTLDTKEIVYGGSIDTFTPIKEGYVFNGWYLDPEYTILFEFETMPAEDLILYANWIIE